jgi:uncharacterized NAD(P)/FAD-binding protein YdhS
MYIHGVGDTVIQDLGRDNDLVIVGGGLAGTVTLIHELIRIADDPEIGTQFPARIMMIERYASQLDSGVAYSESSSFPDDNLNLSSRSCKVFKEGERPAGFPTFPEYIQELAIQARDEKTKTEILDYLQNPPRYVFGNYLTHLKKLALDKAGDKVDVTTLIAEATNLDTSGESPSVIVEDDGEIYSLGGGQIVLATGQQEIQRPGFVSEIVNDPLYLENIYSPPAAFFYGDILKKQAQMTEEEAKAVEILVPGTGLSGYDAATRLLRAGFKGKITMMSRNGLVHAGYAPVTTEEYLQNGLPGEGRPEKVAELEKKLPRFMHLVNKAAELQSRGETYPGNLGNDIVKSAKTEFIIRMKQGYSPEELLSYWERFNTDVASVLTDREVNAIYDKYATWFGAHRIGTTPESDKLIKDAMASGQLEIVAGFFSDKNKLHSENGKIIATYAPAERVHRMDEDVDGKGPDSRAWSSGLATDQAVVQKEFDYVISGLGFSVVYDKNTRDRFWKNLVDAGTVIKHKKADDGIEIDTKDMTIMNASGQRVENVYAVGVPALGAALFSRLPYPEKSGSGGRFPPFFANIVGSVGGILQMGPNLHEKLKASLEQRAALQSHIGLFMNGQNPGAEPQ